MPERWDRDDDGLPRCLRCAQWADPDARQQAVKAALGESTSERLEKRAARARQKQEDAERAEAKVRELIAARDQPWGEDALGAVAAEAGVGRETARKARRALADEGTIPPSPKDRGRRSAKQPPRKPQNPWREETLALVREIGGEVGTQQMIEASGAKPVTVRRRLRHLAREGALNVRRGQRPAGRAGGREPVFYSLPG
jgi:DNA-binding transcriptional regulator YhcF (GntR family)